MLREDIEIADFAETAPLDIENGGHGGDRPRVAVLNRKCTPAGGIGEHSLEILFNPRRWRSEPFLAEEANQQFDRGMPGLTGHRLNSVRRAHPARTIIGVSAHGCWLAAMTIGIRHVSTLSLPSLVPIQACGLSHLRSGLNIRPSRPKVPKGEGS